MLYCPSLKWALLLWRARGLTYWRRVYPVYQPSARPLYRDGGVKAENNGCHHYRGPGLRPSQGHKRYPTVTPRRASHIGCVRRRCGCRTNIHGPRNAGRGRGPTKRPLLGPLSLSNCHTTYPGFRRHVRRIVTFSQLTRRASAPPHPHPLLFLCLLLLCLPLLCLPLLCLPLLCLLLLCRGRLLRPSPRLQRDQSGPQTDLAPRAPQHPRPRQHRGQRRRFSLPIHAPMLVRLLRGTSPIKYVFCT